MVYGVIAKPLERLLPVEVSILGTLALCALLLAIVRWKNRVVARAGIDRAASHPGAGPALRRSRSAQKARR